MLSLLHTKYEDFVNIFGLGLGIAVNSKLQTFTFTMSDYFDSCLTVDSKNDHSSHI